MPSRSEVGQESTPGPVGGVGTAWNHLLSLPTSPQLSLPSISPPLLHPTLRQNIQCRHISTPWPLARNPITPTSAQQGTASISISHTVSALRATTDFSIRESNAMADDPNNRKLKVLTIGAGVTGILMAYRLQQDTPNVDHVIYEKNQDMCVSPMSRSRPR